MPQPPEGFKGIAARRVEEPVERGGAKVAFPARRGVDGVRALGVGKGGEVASRQFLGEGPELNGKVLGGVIFLAGSF